MSYRTYQHQGCASSGRGHKRLLPGSQRPGIRGENIAEAGENGQEKTVGITAEPIIHDFDKVVARALRAARAVAKVLVIRNTVSHGSIPAEDAPRDFEGLRAYLAAAGMESIVWHHPDGRLVKIKARDFGLKRSPGDPG